MRKGSQVKRKREQSPKKIWKKEKEIKKNWKQKEGEKIGESSPTIEYFDMNEWKPLISLFISVSTLHYMTNSIATHYVSLVMNFWDLFELSWLIYKIMNVLLNCDYEYNHSFF